VKGDLYGHHVISRMALCTHCHYGYVRTGVGMIICTRYITHILPNSGKNTHTCPSDFLLVSSYNVCHHVRITTRTRTVTLDLTHIDKLHSRSRVLYDCTKHYKFGENSCLCQDLTYVNM